MAEKRAAHREEGGRRDEDEGTRARRKTAYIFIRPRWLSLVRLQLSRRLRRSPGAPAAPGRATKRIKCKLRGEAAGESEKRPRPKTHRESVVVAPADVWTDDRARAPRARGSHRAARSLARLLDFSSVSLPQPPKVAQGSPGQLPLSARNSPFPSVPPSGEPSLFRQCSARTN